MTLRYLSSEIYGRRMMKCGGRAIGTWDRLAGRGGEEWESMELKGMFRGTELFRIIGSGMDRFTMLIPKSCRHKAIRDGEVDCRNS